jgi:hypothetical protein
MSSALDHRPIANCYWVVPSRFLAGEYPGALDEAEARQRVRKFLEAGLTSFLDLTTEDELIPYTPFLREEAARLGVTVEHRRAPIQDLTVPRPSEMVNILNRIDGAIESGCAIYVHCWGGVGRTGTVVGCYLTRHGHHGQSALDELTRLRKVMEKAAWRVSPETDEQKEFVRNWRE